MNYLLDTNVFIQAKNLHYGLDFCPAFWQWLLDNNVTGGVFSIDKVADEIAAGDDELTDWAKQHGSGLFRATDAAVAAQFGQVSDWVTSQQYKDAAISTFMQVADFYLIAHALAGNFTVVTHEVPANSQLRVKIPNVCAGLCLRFMTPYEMLRRERARFVLGVQP
jgi:predicted nucleic acid-binding protein